MSKQFKAPAYFIKGQDDLAKIREKIGELLNSDLNVIGKLDLKTFSEFMEEQPIRVKEECFRLQRGTTLTDRYIWARFRYDQRNYPDQDELDNLTYDLKTKTIKTMPSVMKKIENLMGQVEKLVTGCKVKIMEIRDDK